MAIKQENVDKIAKLCGAASALGNVTNSDEASKAILARIVELAEGEVTVKATLSQEAVARATSDADNAFKVQDDGTIKVNAGCDKARPLTTLEKWGRFNSLCQNPTTTLAEVHEAAQSLGYRGVGVVMA